MLKELKGKVWITELGGVVDATSPTASRFPLGAPHAARVARYILGPMLRRSPRIARVYFYEWQASSEAVSWDSALVAADGTPRPAYKVIASHLSAGRIAASRAAQGAAGCARPAAVRRRSSRRGGRGGRPRRTPFS